MVIEYTMRKIQRLLFRLLFPNYIKILNASISACSLRADFTDLAKPDGVKFWEGRALEAKTILKSFAGKEPTNG